MVGRLLLFAALASGCGSSHPLPDAGDPPPPDGRIADGSVDDGFVATRDGEPEPGSDAGPVGTDPGAARGTLGGPCHRTGPITIRGVAYDGEVEYCGPGLLCDGARCVEYPECDGPLTQTCRVHLASGNVTDWVATSTDVYYLTTFVMDELGNIVAEPTLWRLPLAGGSPEQLFRHPRELWALWVDDANTYATVASSSRSLLAIPLDGSGELRTLAEFWGASSDATGVDSTHAWGFAGERNRTLYRVPLDGSSGVEAVPVPDAPRYPRSIDGDDSALWIAAGKHIYRLDKAAPSEWEPIVDTSPHDAVLVELAGSKLLVGGRPVTERDPVLGFVPREGGTPFYVAQDPGWKGGRFATEDHVYISWYHGYGGRCSLVRASLETEPTRRYLMADMPFSEGFTSSCAVPGAAVPGGLFRMVAADEERYLYFWPEP